MACRPWSLQASVVAVWALEHRLGGGGARASLLCVVWSLPGPGVTPVSPALAGGLLSTALLGKSPVLFFLKTNRV